MRTALARSRSVRFFIHFIFNFFFLILFFFIILFLLGEFCQLCATFLVEDPDMETMKRELKDAFRIYDKEGQGFITTETLRGLITELLAPLTNEEVEGILEELDEDGSGSMDFVRFSIFKFQVSIFNFQLAPARWTL